MPSNVGPAMRRQQSLNKTDCLTNSHHCLRLSGAQPQSMTSTWPGLQAFVNQAIITTTMTSIPQTLLLVCGAMLPVMLYMGSLDPFLRVGTIVFCLFVIFLAIMLGSGATTVKIVVGSQPTTAQTTALDDGASATRNEVLMADMQATAASEAGSRFEEAIMIVHAIGTQLQDEMQKIDDRTRALERKHANGTVSCLHFFESFANCSRIPALVTKSSFSASSFSRKVSLSFTSVSGSWRLSTIAACPPSATVLRLQLPRESHLLSPEETSLVLHHSSSVSQLQPETPPAVSLFLCLAEWSLASSFRASLLLMSILVMTRRTRRTRRTSTSLPKRSTSPHTRSRSHQRRIPTAGKPTASVPHPVGTLPALSLPLTPAVLPPEPSPMEIGIRRSRCVTPDGP